MIGILSRRSKNNPIILGEPGGWVQGGYRVDERPPTLRGVGTTP